MKKLLLVFFSLISSLVFSQQKERPKIGLALSGGGAKGLAHIGLLKAIDSVGIKVDYVAGTSMGAIVGSLYAAGYTGNEIEEIAHKLDWSKILSNRSSYDMLILPQKRNAEKYLEIPLIDGKFSFRRGILESNELWLTFNELLFPYLTTTDFADFDKAFCCVAADIETGDPVILKKGNIVKAIRASMAIPSIFTPVNIDGKTLIDGGIARNFPVSEAKKMGADMVIGSSVAAPLLKSQDLDNPLQMISQLAFYKENKDYEEQVKFADLLVKYPIEKYNASSFSSSEDILRIGIDVGKDIYPQLKRMKDSLDLLYGKELISPEPGKRIKKIDNILVSRFTTTGLSAKETAFFLKVMGFKDNEYCSPFFLSEKIRKVFGAGTFRKISYELIQDNAPNTYTINLVFEKEPKNIFKTGLHYNTETGIALKLAYSLLGGLNPFSETTIETAIGESPQFNIRNTYFFNNNRTWYLQSAVTGEFTDISTYDGNLKKIGLYNQQHLALKVSASNLITNNFSIGAGTRFEYLKYTPKIKTTPEATGRTHFFTSYVDLHFNNLEGPSYPNKGNNVDFEIGFNYDQHPDFNYFDGTETYTQNAAQFSKQAYFTLRYYSAHHFPVGKNSVFLKLNSGVHLGNKQPLMNDFIIGGNNSVLRNQVLFTGFRANAVSSSSVVSPQAGFQYNLGRKLVGNAIVNYLKYDFIKSNYAPGPRRDSVWGMALLVGYNSMIGPLEAVFMYNDLNNKLAPSFNIGYSLNF